MELEEEEDEEEEKILRQLNRTTVQVFFSFDTQHAISPCKKEMSEGCLLGRGKNV